MKRVPLRFDAPRASVGPLLLGHTPGRAGPVGLVLLLAAGIFIAATGWQLAATQQELALAQAQLQARSGSKPAVAAPARSPLSADERRAWNQLVQQLNTPWSSMLAALEVTTPDDVALVSIEPDARAASVRLQAEAKTLDVLLSYAESLQAAGPFADVVPVKHETNEQDPNRPIRLSLNVRLREQRGAGQ